MLCVSNNNNGVSISANGQYCPIQISLPPANVTSPFLTWCGLLQNSSGIITTDGAVVGAVASIQALRADGNWVTTVPFYILAVGSTALTTQALAISTTYIIQIPGTYHGLRINIASLTAGTLYAELDAETYQGY